jgi:Glycosyltransferase
MIALGVLMSPATKIAIIHDWYVTYAGAERVVEKILKHFPNADLFSVVDFLEDREFIMNKTVKTTFIQNLPFAKRKYRAYLPLMPIAIEQLDLSRYDVIISSSHAVAKGVLVGPDQLHICMCYSPIRYAWDMQHQYLEESGLNKGFKSLLARYILHKIRLWDVRTASGVDHFIAISDYIARRINKCYRRDSTVIYPPVFVDKFEFLDKKENYYLTSSRQVPYKKIDLIVEAFNRMPDKELIVIGDGPMHEKIKSIANSNVIILGYQSNAILVEYLKKAKAFIFAAEEDFGIAPLEAQASGTPVIAFGKGGAVETILNKPKYGIQQTGVFFYSQTTDAIISAIDEFESLSISPYECRKNAERFSENRFDSEFNELIQSLIKK